MFPINKQIISVESLLKSLVTLLSKLGLEKVDAMTTAEILIEADLRGYPLHGVERIFQILAGVSNGTLNLNSTPVLIRSSLSMAIFDGQHGLGQTIAKKAMHLAVEKAYESGVGVVGVINSGHIGALSYYSEIASRNNCVGLVMSTSSPAVVIAGGKIKTFGTNPISYSFPPTTVPITADFSTSKVSRSVIIDYHNTKEKIPFGWAVNSDGLDTDDPAEALNGGIQTIDGDVKGSLLSMLVSVFAGHLLGGVVNSEVTGTRYMDNPPNKGDFFMALSIPHFTSNEVFQEKSDFLKQFIAQQGTDFRVPGEKSVQNRINQINNGIEASKELIELFKEYDINI